MSADKLPQKFTSVIIAKCHQSVTVVYNIVSKYINKIGCNLVADSAN